MKRQPVVLVVEDELDILEALAEILEVEGCVVRKARNGVEGLACLLPDPPDIILLDLMMPVMNGWEFSQRLRQLPAMTHIPIIVLSATPNISAGAKLAGAAGYLAKPFELKDLLDMVDLNLRALDASRQARLGSPPLLTVQSALEEPMTAKDILETEIPNALKNKPDLTKDINAIVHFVITGDQGGTWTLDLTKSSDWVTTGASGTPKMTITCSDQDLVKIRQKQLNPQMAAMQGKLKFKPMDMGLAMKLGKLLA